MLLDQTALGIRQRPGLVQDPVRDPDLADVVEQEAELEARVVEQARVDELRERQRVMLDALRMAARARILRLECICKRRDRLAVRMLQQATLPAFHLDDPAQVTGIDEQLLGIAFAAGDDAFVRRLVEPVDQRQQRQWAERLPQNRPRARPLRFLDRRARSRQHHDRRRVVTTGGELTAKREPVEARQLHVEQHDGGTPEPRDLTRFLRRRDFLDLELARGERLSQQQPQRGVVVNDEDPAASAGPEISVELRRLHRHGRKRGRSADLPPRSLATKIACAGKSPV